jgi:hypothetical protein
MGITRGRSRKQTAKKIRDEITSLAGRDTASDVGRSSRRKLEGKAIGRAMIFKNPGGSTEGDFSPGFFSGSFMNDNSNSGALGSSRSARSNYLRKDTSGDANWV